MKLSGSRQHAQRLLLLPSSARCVTYAEGTTARRWIQTTAPKPANPLTHPTVPGPPPKAPMPSASFADERIQKKKKQLEMLKKGQEMKTNPSKPGQSLRKRFWKDVKIEDTPDGYQILLDTRPVRGADKSALVVPHSKPHLATAIALEWDHLVMAAQALKQHYIPLTSLTSRAHDIAAADAAHAARHTPDNPVRDPVVAMLLRYLRTDTLLCWAPDASSYPAFDGTTDGAAAAAAAVDGPSLRQLQQRAASPIVAHLTRHVWPGVELHPALDDGSIVPRAQPPHTLAVVRGWLAGLPAWELAGLERAVLASKSLCVGVRLVVEWSGAFRAQRTAWTGADAGAVAEGKEEVGRRFGVEDAAAACTQEVAYQTRSWGEVEDTHDVDKEDLRRQLGSAVLLVHDR